MGFWGTMEIQGKIFIQNDWDIFKHKNRKLQASRFKSITFLNILWGGFLLSLNDFVSMTYNNIIDT